MPAVPMNRLRLVVSLFIESNCQEIACCRVRLKRALRPEFGGICTHPSSLVGCSPRAYASIEVCLPQLGHCHSCQSPRGPHLADPPFPLFRNPGRSHIKLVGSNLSPLLQFLRPPRETNAPLHPSPSRVKDEASHEGWKQTEQALFQAPHNVEPRRSSFPASKRLHSPPCPRIPVAHKAGNRSHLSDDGGGTMQRAPAHRSKNWRVPGWSRHRPFQFRPSSPSRTPRD